MEPVLSFKSRADYRKWLEDNCNTSGSVWIEFYKDGTKGIHYQDALEESLCYGWIDSLIKKVDERTYVRKFSKRTGNSKWSEINKDKVKELISKGGMTVHGLSAVENAKINGTWDKCNTELTIDTNEFRAIIQPWLSSVTIYDNLTESLKAHYSKYYFDAKKDETRKKRLDMIIEYIKTKKRIL